MPDPKADGMAHALRLLALAVLALSCSCMRSDRLGDIDRLKAVARGMTVQEVEGVLGPEHRLQFHAMVASADVLCLSYAFCTPYDLLYFVFKDGTLARIAEPPPFAYQDIDYTGDRPEWKGTTLSIRVAVDPWQRMGRVLAAPDLSGQAAVASISRRCPQDHAAMAIIPACIIAAPLLPFSLAGRANEYRINRGTQRRYDPQRIVLASTIAEVLELFGAPLKSGEVNGLLVDTFGIDNHLSLIDPSDVAPFFDVVYDKFGKVRDVFCDDFHPPSRP
jgi:hypothetical protein